MAAAVRGDDLEEIMNPLEKIAALIVTGVILVPATIVGLVAGPAAGIAVGAIAVVGMCACLYQSS